MLKRLWLLVIVLLLSLGCGSPLPHPETGYKCSTEGKTLERTYYIDSTFDDNEIVWIIIAAENWNRATNNVVKYTYGGKVTHVVPPIMLRTPGIDGIYIYRGADGDPVPSENPLLWGKSNWNFVVLVTDRMKSKPGDYQKRFTAVSMHEFGHTMGIGHIPERSALMYESCAQSCTDPVITLYDLNTFCKSASEDWRWPEAIEAFEDLDTPL